MEKGRRPTGGKSRDSPLLTAAPEPVPCAESQLLQRPSTETKPISSLAI